MNKSSASDNSMSNTAVSKREDVTVCDNIQALTISAMPESTGVTSFVQEACEQVEVLGSHYVSSKLNTHQPDVQDLKEYFNRPRVIASGSSTLNVRGQQVSLDINKLNLFNTYFPNSFSRLLGVYGLRFRMVFTLQMAATSFSQGVVCLSFQYNTTGTSATTYLRAAASSTATNIPHVRCDISETTMVQLSVPFMYQREFLTVNAGDNTVNEWTYGVLSLNNILPVRTGSGNNPTYTIFIHLEDLELIGASPESWSNISYQAGKPIEKEFEDDAYPYSSTLHSASRTARWIAKGIPAISSIAGTTSWFLGKAAGVVRYFGYATPLVQEPPIRQMRVDTILEQNVDVPSQSVMVGPMCSNRLKVDPQFASTDVDEMSLAYVLGQWSQIRYNAITNTDVRGTLINGMVVSPCHMHFTTTVTSKTMPVVGTVGYNSVIPSNLLYWGSCFRQWRGDLEYRFTFAKTKLHAGRVIVYYTPSNITASQLTAGSAVTLKGPDVTGGPHPFGYSAIFDLKDGNVFTFKVPFISDTPYKDIWGATGTLNMYVMDQLNASSTISTTVDILTEVRCMPDFELSIPMGNVYPAATVSVPTLQAGTVTSAISNNASEAVIGEQIMSVKQLISMPANVWNPGNTVLAGNNAVQTLWPWWQQGPLSNTTPPAALGTYELSPFTMGAYAARAYCYVRGSTDFHFYFRSQDTVNTLVYQHAAPGINALTGASVPFSLNNTSYVQTSQDSMHVRVPGYARTSRYVAGSLNNVVYSASGLAFSDTTPFQFTRVRFENSGAANASIKITRAAGDDAMLGHYMGPVPLLLNNAALSGGAWDAYTTLYQSSKEVFHSRTGCVIMDDFEDIDGKAMPLNCQQKEVAPPPTPSRNRSMRPPSPFKVSGDVGVKPDNLSGKLTSLLARAELLPKYANLTAQVAEVVSEALDQQ